MLVQNKKQIEQQLKLQRQISALETLAKQYLEPDAITRYGTLKTAHAEKALQAIAAIAQLVNAGQLTKKLSDAEFKQLLIQLESGKMEFRIRK